MLANQVIREQAKARGVRLWEIADKLGINDGNFSRKLRRELPEEEREKVLGIIEKLASEREATVCPM